MVRVRVYCLVGVGFLGKRLFTLCVCMAYAEAPTAEDIAADLGQ